LAEVPTTDGRDPASLIPAAVERVLELANTWVAWDGRPRYGDGNAWTPHKALRRVADHLLDHLAEIDALLAGEQTLPEHWLGRTVTLDADFARFTESDLHEASCRLLRFGEMYRVRFTARSAEDLDAERPNAWTLRQIAHHVSNVVWYAEQVGDLASQSDRDS
jgi:hypothetical protein